MGNSIQQLMVMIGGDSTGLQSAMTGADKALKEFGMSFKAITAAMSFSAVIAGVVEAGMVVEKASIQMQRATGAAGETLKAMDQAFRDLYVTSAESGDAIAAALSSIAQKTGETGEALEALAGSALRFAKVTGSDLKTSVEANEKVFAQWHIATKDQAVALDAMYVASQRSGISAEKLAQSLLTITPALLNLGFRFDTALALIASFEKAGLDATDMTMGLNKAFVAFAQAGRDPYVALEGLIQKMKESSSRVAALNLAMDSGFTGKVVGRFVDAVRSGAFELSAMTKSVDESAGSVQKMADKTDTLSAAWTKLTRQMSVGVVGGIGQGVVSSATEALSGFDLILEEIHKKFLTWNDIVKGGIVGLRGFLSSGMLSGGLEISRSLAEADIARRTYAGKFDNVTAPTSPKNIGEADAGNSGIEAARIALEAYSQKLTEAEQHLGLNFDKERELQKSLDLVTAAYHAGTVSLVVYAQALKNYNEESDKLNKNNITFAQLQTAQGVRPLPKAPIALEEDTPDITKLPTGSGVFGATDRVGESFRMIKEAMDSLMSDQATMARNTVIDQQNFDLFGLRTVKDYEKTADASKLAYEQIRDGGQASARDVAIAFQKMQLDAQMALLQTGQESVSAWTKNTEQIKAVLATLEGHTDLMKAPELGMIGSQIESVFGNFGNVIETAILHTRDLSRAFSDMGRSIVSTIIKDVTQMAIGKMLTSLSQTGSLFGNIGESISGMFKKVAAQSAAAAALSKAISSASNIAEITGYANVGAAAAYASTSAIPIVGPGLAPEVAAATRAAIMAFAPMGSFALGGELPSDGTYLGHVGEYVIDRSLSSGLRQMVAQQRAGTYVAPSMMGGDVHVHLEGAQFSGGVTRQMVDQVMNAAVKAARRGGATNL